MGTRRQSRSRFRLRTTESGVGVRLPGRHGLGQNDGSECTQPTGKDTALDRLGWFDENSGGDTHPVGEKAPNAWGLYDMHGNVWEWCLDGKRPYSTDLQTDPVGPTVKNARRVVRGCCYWNHARHCLSASRCAFEPGLRGGTLGFRLAAGWPPAPEAG